MDNGGFQHSGDNIRKQEQNLALQKHAMRCVARVLVAGQENGTGVLLPDNWFLTCNHVLRDKEAATKDTSTAQFGYALGEGGQISESIQFHFDPTQFYCSEEHDWTLVKLKPHLTKGIPGVLFQGGLTLQTVDPQPGSVVIVIQHPMATLQKSAEGMVTKTSLDRLYHQTATLGGSSGAPVFDGAWRIVALHRGRLGDGEKEAVHVCRIIAGITECGRWPLESLGLPPVAEHGPMAADSPWYIRRTVDDEAEKHLIQQKAGTLAVVGTTGLGKSSLVERLKTTLEGQGWQSATVDLKSELTDEHRSSTRDFFRQIAAKIHHQIGGSPAALKVFEEDATASAFKVYLGELGRSPGNPLLLILDQVEVLCDLPCASSVLTGLRSAHNQYATPGARKWLKIVLMMTIKPQQRDLDGSIFDIAEHVHVSDFTIPEMHELIARFGSLQMDAERLHAFLGGQPALTRQALNKLAAGQADLDRLIHEAKNNGGLFRRHLEGLYADFRRLPQGVALAEALRQFLGGKPLDSEETFKALFALGVVTGPDAARARPRCELYQHWLPDHLPR